MIGVSETEKEIAAQLNPLRLALEQNGVLVAALPKQSGAYSEEVREGIDIIISKVIGVTAPDNFSAQDIQYTITIYISLGLRYQDTTEEKNVLDWVGEQVFKLLHGFQLKNAKTALSFIDYTPLKPENGQWLAQMQFQYTRQARLAPPIDEGSIGVDFVQLFGQGVQPQDVSLITQIPNN